MLWVKAFHILFVTSWFAGLFYLPRIYVNLAQAGDPAVRATLCWGLWPCCWQCR